MRIDISFYLLTNNINEEFYFKFLPIIFETKNCQRHNIF